MQLAIGTFSIVPRLSWNGLTLQYWPVVRIARMLEPAHEVSARVSIWHLPVFPTSWFWVACTVDDALIRTRFVSRSPRPSSRGPDMIPETSHTRISHGRVVFLLNIVPASDCAMPHMGRVREAIALQTIPIIPMVSANGRVVGR